MIVHVHVCKIYMYTCTVYTSFEEIPPTDVLFIHCCYFHNNGEKTSV